MRRLIIVVVTLALLGVMANWLRGNQGCVGIFLDPNEVLVAQDPAFLRDPANQIRLYERLRIGQRLTLTITACDPDGDPIGQIVPYLTSSDVTWTVSGAQITVRYTARPPAKREVLAWVLTDAPLDPNTLPASRIAALIIDVTKNNPPNWR